MCDEFQNGKFPGCGLEEFETKVISIRAAHQCALANKIESAVYIILSTTITTIVRVLQVKTGGIIIYQIVFVISMLLKRFRCTFTKINKSNCFEKEIAENSFTQASVHPSRNKSQRDFDFFQLT